MKTVKIFVCCHKQFDVENIEILVPIHVGAELAPKLWYKVTDNTGDNISYLNKSYCELTALYWMWKNSESDYYGLFHYRRYLMFLQGMINDYQGNRFTIPYKIYKYPDSRVLRRIGYYDKDVQEKIEQYDIIMPIAENMHTKVYDHYVHASNHYKKDIDLVVDIIKKEFPTYADAMEKYMNGEYHYFGNIFICNKEIFNDYCTWLFSILAIYDSKKDVSGYNTQELRVNGYLAERLLGIYYTWLKDNNNTLRWAEVPRAHFECMGNSKTTYYKKRIINILLPPSSKRRMLVKTVKSKTK